MTDGQDILVADASPASLVSALSDMGFSVHALCSGKAVLAYLETATPELVLLDEQLTDMSGLALLESLNARGVTRTLPVLFLGTSMESREQALEWGAADGLPKPFSNAELRKRVQNLLELSRLRQNHACLPKPQGVFESQKGAAPGLDEAFPLSTLGMAMLNLEGRFLRVNSALCSLLGRTEAELLAMTFHPITHPDDLDECLDHAKCLMEGKTLNVRQEKRYLHKEGRAIWVEVHGTLIRDEGGNPLHFLALIQDINARKQAEERFRKAFYDNPISMAITRFSDSRITDVNDAWVDLTGWSRDEAIGKTREELSLFPESEQTAAMLEILGEAGMLRAFPARVKRKDGDYREILMSADLADLGGEPYHISSAQDMTELRKVEASLEETHELLQTVFDTSPIGLEIYDKNAVLIRANRKIDELFGANVQALIGSFNLRQDPNYQLPEVWARLDRGEIVSHELEFNPDLVSYAMSRRDRFWLSVIATPISEKVSRRVGFVLQVTDITERKRAEAAVKRELVSLEIQAGIHHRRADSSRDFLAFALKEAIRLTGSCSGCISLFRNPHASASWGAEQAADQDEDVETIELGCCFESDMEGGARCSRHPGCVLDECIRQGRPVLQNELGTSLPQPRRFLAIPIYTQHRLDGAIGVCGKASDYTEWDTLQLSLLMDGVWKTVDLMKTRESLQSSEALYRSTFDLAPVGIAKVSLEEKYEKVNPRYAQILGYEVDELIGKGPLELTHPEDRARSHGRIEQLLEGQAPSSLFIKRYLHKDGHVVWGENSVLLIRDRDGKPLYFLGILLDITEIKKAEDAKAMLESQLHHAQKMESLGALTGGVAHDLNNVLSAILSMSSSLRAQTLPPDPAAKALDTIISACTRGRDVIRRMLIFSRQELEQEGAVDLNDVVREVTELLSRTTLMRISLVTRLEEGLPEILGDANALSHVLINLCVNAVDAMPEGGTLTLSSTRHPEGALELSVEDTGQGMSADVLERAMEPFFTTKAPGKGTGLGLSMVYGAMKAHEGRVELQSRPGKGTTVRLIFPHGRVLEKKIPATAPPPEPAVSKKHRILVVDDEELLRASTSALLQVLGHEVQAVEGGLEAIQILQGGFQADLVILDMNMPGMDGATTLPRIRSIRPDQRVVIASGFMDQRAEALKRDYSDLKFLSKPFTLLELKAVVESL